MIIEFTYSLKIKKLLIIMNGINFCIHEFIKNIIQQLILIIILKYHIKNGGIPILHINLIRIISFINKDKKFICKIIDDIMNK